MSAYEPSFDERLRRLNRKHRRMAENGVMRRMGPDGLVVEYPRRRLPRFPWQAIVILLAVAFVFKAWILSSLGAAEFDARVDLLRAGTVVERAAAAVFQADPASAYLAGWIGRSGL